MAKNPNNCHCANMQPPTKHDYRKMTKPALYCLTPEARGMIKTGKWGMYQCTKCESTIVLSETNNA